MLKNTKLVKTAKGEIGHPAPEGEGGQSEQPRKLKNTEPTINTRLGEDRLRSMVQATSEEENVH